MAKAKNRDKRKKAQAKAINVKREQEPQFYDGYMVIPLDPSLSDMQVRNRCEFFDEFRNRSVVNEVLGYPHRYKMTAHVFSRQYGKAVATVDKDCLSERRTIPEMAQIAFAAAREKENDIDMPKSYVVLRAQKLTDRDRKAIDAERLIEKKKVPIMGLNYAKAEQMIKKELELLSKNNQRSQAA